LNEYIRDLREREGKKKGDSEKNPLNIFKTCWLGLRSLAESPPKFNEGGAK